MTWQSCLHLSHSVHAGPVCAWTQQAVESLSHHSTNDALVSQLVYKPLLNLLRIQRNALSEDLGTLILLELYFYCAVEQRPLKHDDQRFADRSGCTMNLRALSMLLFIMPHEHWTLFSAA
jgi:hypothetical protein